MSKEILVPLCVGLALIVLGFFMTTRDSVARWGVTHGSGRIWARLLGEERAVKLTRRFFGPLTMVLGALAMLSGLSRP